MISPSQLSSETALSSRLSQPGIGVHQHDLGAVADGEDAGEADDEHDGVGPGVAVG